MIDCFVAHRRGSPILVPLATLVFGIFLRGTAEAHNATFSKLPRRQVSAQYPVLTRNVLRTPQSTLSTAYRSSAPMTHGPFRQTSFKQTAATSFAVHGVPLTASSNPSMRRAHARRWSRPFYRFSLEVEGGPLWQSRNEAAIPGDTGTRFNVDDVTGAGPFLGGRVTMDWALSRRHRMRALIAPLTIEASGSLPSDVTFRDETFVAGGRTTATFKFNSYRLGYRYLVAENDKWSFFFGATAKIRDAKIQLEQDGKFARKTDLGFVPLLHADVEWRPRPGWRVTADLDALGAPQGRAIDFALKLHRDFTPHWSVGIGYRTIEGGADNDNTYTFSWLHQVVLSVTYRF